MQADIRLKAPSVLFSLQFITEEHGDSMNISQL